MVGGVATLHTLGNSTGNSDGGSSVSHSPEELVNVSCLMESCQSTTVVHSLGRGREEHIMTGGEVLSRHYCSYSQFLRN